MTADESVDGEPEAQRADQDNNGAERTIARSAAFLALAMVVAMAGLAGWLGFRAYESKQENQQRALFLATARQAAVNLTTLSHAEIEANIQRIVDSSIGNFHDEFQSRSAAFADVVKQAKSTSEGTVTAAGLESMLGDQAQVVVAVSVKTSNAGAPEQEPRGWRMRISVAKVGDGAKVSDVQFVP